MKFTFLLLVALNVCLVESKLKFVGHKSQKKGVSARFDSEGEQCSLAESELPSVKILLLVDGTISKDSTWAAAQTRMVEILPKKIQSQYNAEFALATFGTWKGGNCYKLLHGFTNDFSAIVKTVKHLPGDSTQNILSECSLTIAILLGAADATLEWDTSLFTLSQKPTRNAIIMFPLKLSSAKLADEKNRREPLGDGSDTCENSLPPSPMALYKVLEAKNIFVFMFGVEIEGRPRDAIAEFYGYRLYEDFYSGAVLTDDESDDPLTETQFREVDWKDEADIFFDDVLNPELSTCQWEDPPAYNTLGV